MKKHFLIWTLCFFPLVFSTTPMFSQSDSVKLGYNLLQSVYINSMDSAIYFLKKGANVNYRDDKGLTPIFYAIQNNNVDMVELLEFNGADINVKNNDGATPLIFSIWASNFDIAEYLCYKGANPNTPGLYRFMPLHYAIQQGDYFIADMLIFYGANVNSLTLEKNSSLHYAAYFSDTAFVELLLRHGAKEMHKNFNNMSPLEIAIQYRNNETAKILLALDSSSLCSDIGVNSLIAYAINNDNDSFALFLVGLHKFIPPTKNDAQNPYNLALLYRKMDTAKQLKSNGYYSGVLPYFYDYDFFSTALLSKDDVFYNFKIGTIDLKYDLKIDFGFGTRFKRKAVLVSAGNENYYQYWERRNYINLGIKKYFYINPNSELFSLFAGFELNSFFGNYRGSSRKIDNRFAFSPNFGMALNFGIAQFELSYNYMNYGSQNISPNFLSFGIGVRFNSLKNLNI